MSNPYGPQPHAAQPNFMPMAYPQPVPLPPGAGALVVSVNRGPYLIPVPTAAKLKIDGRQVSIPSEGTWHIPLPAGPHEIKYTDFLGIPMVTTSAMVHPGAASYLSFRFGAWRNRVYDGAGADVTKFGLWSNYLIMLVVFVPTMVICCGGTALLSAFGA